jgi:hypothetical protein
MSNNGWIQSTDPTTGRIFYANKYTRTTQWEVPDEWQGQKQTNSTAAELKLPEGWEEATDPKSGKTFYINHLQKVTTWNRPASHAERGNGGDYNLNAITLNKYGSHSHWIDPTKGSRYSKSLNEKSSDLPLLEYTTVQVPDSLRPTCPSCRGVFTTLKRRHHCRLCGDVFCDGCSSGRAVLPLEGEEFNKSVRVCDWCLGDVKR